MEPKFKDGSYALILLGSNLALSIGNVIVLEDPKGLMIKRITGIYQNGFQLVGDNSNDSYDSRDFGLIQRQVIVGKVIWS